MSHALRRLKESLESGTIDLPLMAEAEREAAERARRADELEELLIMIVRTGWPWDEEGEPNAIYHASRDGFAAAMAGARDLLGLSLRSTITRTEPRT